MSTNANHPAVQTYLRALREARHFEPPFNAVLITMLTSVLQIHELTSPSTHLEAHSLAAGHGDGARRMPAPSALTATLGGCGSVTKILSVVGVSPATLRGLLDSQLMDHDGLAGASAVEEVWALAVDGLIAAATEPEVRRAVRAWIGHGVAAEHDLKVLADLIDTCCRRAGYTFG